MTETSALPPILHQDDAPWQEHPRFKNIYLKMLVKGEQNPFASIALVKIPPGGVIGIHIHPQEIETIYVMSGEGVFTLGEQEGPLRAGQIVAVPIATNHGMRNESDQPIELLTIFTPPIF